ncbi:hypothetical protein CRV03_03575 [Arcobacter sp. F155]|uniref:hypothetical protein n=1 Tax=Arcobacter sp. F155 TaxID=2044512 RepID=UPI00100A41B6|nr:hypothetical protein [Arcobacter sp. F155]RXJ78062.1 hypothetical protein CRV03_03575 [Arcobacter sp. F155]
MSKTDYKKKVVEFVKSAKPRSTGHKLNSQDDFLDGIVAQVEYMDGTSNVVQWIIVTNKHTSYADTESQLIQQMNVASKSFSSKFDWFNQIFNIGGIIALVLVGTASYISLNNPSSEIPEYLKTALLTVVGFYFGGYVSQGLRKKNKEND